MILVAGLALIAGAVFAQGGAPVKIVIAVRGRPVDFVARIGPKVARSSRNR